jgi:hypothetical protein
MFRYLPLAAVLGLAVASSGTAQDACPTPSSTFELIQRGIFERHSCTVSYCHGDSMQAGLDLRAGHSYRSLFQAGEVGIPGQPEQSQLWSKLAAKTLGVSGVPGRGMPLGALPISSDELEGIRLWIQAGAPENGTVEGVANLIDACPPPALPEAEATSLPPCQPGDRSLVLPDLTIDPPTDIRVMIGPDGHRRIEFSTAVGNVGRGPLIVQPATPATHPNETLGALQVILRDDGSMCSRPAGVMTLGPDTAHWAYGNTVDFELRKNDPVTGERVAHSSKMAYCLLDTDPIRTPLSSPHQFESHCTDLTGRMGISSGYKDLYAHVAPGQWIDLDSDPNSVVKPGPYYLVNIVNPENTLLAANAGAAHDTNYTRVTVRIAPPTPPHAHPTRPSPHAQRTPGPTEVTGTAPLAQRLKTGQTQCDQGRGTLRVCPGSPAGQDGALGKGLARSYTDNGNGTITDPRTGLMWEKLSRDGSIHDYGTTYTWYSAFTTKIATLNSGGGFAGYTDWRLPNVNELQSIINYGAVLPAVEAVFNTGCAAGCTVTTCSCTQSYDYWSSTTYEKDPSFAWFVLFYDGIVYGYSKSGSYYVRAVRGGP